MADEDEDITIDLRLRDYLANSARDAAAAMEDLADNTRQAARALQLLDRRADRAANSLTRLTAATRAASAGMGGLNQATMQTDRAMNANIQTQRNMQRQMNRTGNDANRLNRENHILRRGVAQLAVAMRLAAGGARLMGMAFVAAGAAGVAGHLIVQVLQVASALSSLISFAALAPVAIGGLIAVILTLKTAFSGINKLLKSEFGSMFDQFKGLRTELQKLFMDLLNEKMVRRAFKNLFPTVRTGMRQMVQEVGEMSNELAAYFSSTKGKTLFENFFRAGNGMVFVLSNNIRGLISGLGDVVNTAMPSWTRFLTAVDSGLGKLSDWMAQISSDGSLERWLDNAFIVAKQLWTILSQVGTIIGGVLKAASAGGSSPLGALGVALAEISKWVNSTEGQAAFTSFFQSLAAVATAVAPILTTVAGIIGTTIAPALANIVTNLAPYVNEFFMQLGQALQIIAPYMGPLAEAIGRLLVALTPLLPVIAEFAVIMAQELTNNMPMVTQLISLLAMTLQSILAPVLPVITAFLQILTPIIQTFLAAFQSQLPVIVPLLTEFGIMLAQAFMQVLPMLMEILPQVVPLIIQLGIAFGQHLIIALQQLLPLMPEIINLIAALLPVVIPMIPAALQLAIMILRIATAMAPVQAAMVGFIAGMLNMAAAAIRTGQDIINGIIRIVGPILDAIGNVRGAINRGIDMFANFAGSVIGSIDRVVGAIGRIAGAVSNAIGSLGRLASAAANIDINPFRFAGGPVVGGQKYTIGEIGPEMWVGNNGQTKLIGAHGMDPDWTAPGSGTIIPSGLTKAIQSVQDRVAAIPAPSGITANELAAVVAGASGETHHWTVPVTIQGNVKEEIDIERAVKSAIEAAERDRRERS